MDLFVITHAVPLIAIISFVYCASRFELPSRIIGSGLVMFIKTAGFLGLMYAFLIYLSS